MVIQIARVQFPLAQLLHREVRGVHEHRPGPAHLLLGVPPEFVQPLLKLAFQLRLLGVGLLANAVDGPGGGQGVSGETDGGLAAHSGSPVICSPKDTMVSIRKFCMVRVSSYSWWRMWMNSSISVPASILVPIIKVRLLM